MQTTRLSNKGQVSLPKSVRDAHHWSAGTEFEIEDRPEGVLLRPKKHVAITNVSEIIGCTGYRGPTKSLEEMDEAIAQGVTERHACGRY
jgi:AbrB family looped-hinge helix DNA binding protein